MVGVGTGEGGRDWPPDGLLDSPCISPCPSPPPTPAPVLQVSRGYRPPIKNSLPADLQDLIADCWAQEASVSYWGGHTGESSGVCCHTA